MANPTLLQELFCSVCGFGGLLLMIEHDEQTAMKKHVSFAAVITTLAFLGLVFVLLSFVAGRRATKPTISIGVLSYAPWAGKGPSLSVRVGITNTSHTTIRYNQFNFNGDAWVRTESRSGWTIRDIGPGAVFGWMPALLRPGSNTVVIIALPSDSLRWQVGYKVQAASWNRRVTSMIPGKWLNRLRPLCDRFLSDKEGPVQEVQSDLFECPHNEPTPVGDGMPTLFSPDAFWPAIEPAR